jgi:hypothetical protein
MYLLRRVFKVKPGTARKTMAIITQIGKLYEEAGQRTHSRVYMSGGVVPGPANTVYMDWTEETLRSPYRKENKHPEGMSELGSQLRDFQEESYIEFYEMFSAE